MSASCLIKNRQFVDCLQIYVLVINTDTTHTQNAYQDNLKILNFEHLHNAGTGGRIICLPYENR